MQVPATTTDGVFSPGRRALTVGLVFTVTLVAFEGLAAATILKVINDDLRDIGLLGWVLSAFFLGSLFGVVAAGYEADRKGPAAPFIGGLSLFALGLLGAGLAPTMVVLVTARAVQGIGAGAIGAIAYVAIGRAYPGNYSRACSRSCRPRGSFPGSSVPRSAARWPRLSAGVGCSSVCCRSSCSRP